MGLTQLHLVTIYSTAVVLVLSLTFVSGEDMVLRKTSEKDFDMEQYPKDDLLTKRPFCNAFTGCGMKRDDRRNFYEPNSEPAAEEISRRILSEAKMWETEMERQRNHGLQENLIPRNVPLALAMPNLRRKRAATAFEQKSQTINNKFNPSRTFTSQSSTFPVGPFFG